MMIKVLQYDCVNLEPETYLTEFCDKPFSQFAPSRNRFLFMLQSRSSSSSYSPIHFSPYVINDIMAAAVVVISNTKKRGNE